MSEKSFQVKIMAMDIILENNYYIQINFGLTICNTCDLFVLDIPINFGQRGHHHGRSDLGT
jgi:hypothetical protein